MLRIRPLAICLVNIIWLQVAWTKAIQGLAHPNQFNVSRNQSEWELEFKAAQALGFRSARIDSMLDFSSNSNASVPSLAVPAAVATNHSLLLTVALEGIPGNLSDPETSFTEQLKALQGWIAQYPNLDYYIDAISVGYYDLNWSSPVDPVLLGSYIDGMRSSLSNTTLWAVPIGHIDDWLAWVNISNAPVVQASDFVGTGIWPMLEDLDPFTNMNSSIQFFWDAYNKTKQAVNKPVWLADAGWPFKGYAVNTNIATPDNARAYWDAIGCAFFGTVNTWWFSFRDVPSEWMEPMDTSIVGPSLSASSTNWNWNLTCPGLSSTSIPSTSNSSSTPNQPSSSSSSGSHAGTLVGPIVGSVIGGIVLVVVVGLLVFIWRRRRHPTSLTMGNPHEEPNLFGWKSELAADPSAGNKAPAQVQVQHVAVPDLVPKVEIGESHTEVHELASPISQLQELPAEWVPSS